MELTRVSDSHECILYKIFNPQAIVFQENPRCLERLASGFFSSALLRECVADFRESEQLHLLKHQISSHLSAENQSKYDPTSKELRKKFFIDCIHIIRGSVVENEKLRAFDEITLMTKALIVMLERFQSSIEAIDFNSRKLFFFIQHLGPIVVQANIGTHRYTVDPILSKETFGDQLIYYFPKGSEIVPSQSATPDSAILLVGADWVKGRIYFYEERFSRKEPLSQKLIFMISWDRFTQFVKESSAEKIPVLFNSTFDPVKYD